MTSGLIDDLERICREHGAIALYAFGSRGGEIAGAVRGQAAAAGPAGSDLDVGVLLPRGATIDERSRVRLAAALEDLFAVPRVDLVVVGEASSFLAVEAVSGELLVDLAPRQTAEFELFALRRAGDLLPFQRARIAAVIREGAR